MNARTKIWILFGIIIIITALTGLVDWPTGPDLKIGSYFKELKIHQGLDLQGGTQLIYEMDTSKIETKDRRQAEESVLNIINQRVNILGVAEPIIQTTKISGRSGLIIELPGIKDVNQAVNLIGKTAQLSFWEIDSTSGELTQTQLNGGHLQRADVQFDQSGNPQVSIQFNSRGKDIFAELTQKNLQKPLAIKLDEEIISAPTVQTVIKNGNAVITGKFSVQEAKQLAKLLNAGSLPVPLTLTRQENIGATLGLESIRRSLVAGLVGMALIGLFMILYYRLAGFLAVLALAIYSLIVLALFKLIPVTLTLAGIAGFILSIGMAVDANILIFERMREERRRGKTPATALDEGFRRAWPSIRDSNISSLITCTILFYFGTGIVRGFALTLAIGIMVSMFTAITVSRTFLKLTIGRPKENEI